MDLVPELLLQADVLTGRICKSKPRWPLQGKVSVKLADKVHSRLSKLEHGNAWGNRTAVCTCFTASLSMTQYPQTKPNTLESIQGSVTTLEPLTGRQRI